jgi:hypothetical protein
MLYRRIDSLVRASQVLRVERAKRSRDRWVRFLRCFFPGLAQEPQSKGRREKKLWVPHGRGAA